MADIRLKVQKRAISGKGRARIHTALLTELDIEEGADIDVTADSGKRVIVSAFADDLVEQGVIRISADDLKTLGAGDGDTVTVKKAPDTAGQVKRAAKETTDAAKKNITEAGKSLKSKADAAAKDTADAAKKNISEAGKTLKSKADSAAKETTDAAKKVSKNIEKAGKNIARDAKKKTDSLLKNKDL